MLRSWPIGVAAGWGMEGCEKLWSQSVVNFCVHARAKQEGPELENRQNPGLQPFVAIVRSQTSGNPLQKPD